MGAVIYIFGLVVTLLNNYIINSSSKVIDKKVLEANSVIQVSLYQK